MDHDGWLDVLSAYVYTPNAFSSNEYRIEWYRNNGNGTIDIQANTISTSSSGGPVQSLLVDDFDGDEVDDIAICHRAGHIEWYERHANGTFLLRPILLNSKTIILCDVADLNDDSYPDILFVSWNGTGYELKNGEYRIEYILNKGDATGSFHSEVHLVYSHLPSTQRDSLVNHVSAADFNGDGLLDVLTAWGNGDTDDLEQNIVWFRNLGGGEFNSSSFHCIFCGDNNNTTDLYVPGPQWWGGTFNDWQYTDQTSWLTTGDVNDDGWLDVFSGFGSCGKDTCFFYGLFINEGRGKFDSSLAIQVDMLEGMHISPASIISKTIAMPSAVTLADMDNDGTTDLVSYLKSNEKPHVVTLYKNRWVEQMPSYTAQANLILSENHTEYTSSLAAFHDLVSADIDGDGYLDLVTASGIMPNLPPYLCCNRLSCPQSFQNNGTIAWFKNVQGQIETQPRELNLLNCLVQIDCVSDGYQIKAYTSLQAADADNDGFADLFFGVGRQLRASADTNDLDPQQHGYYFIHNVNGSFVDEPIALFEERVRDRRVLLFDPDADGLLDLLAHEITSDSSRPHRFLWKRNGGIAPNYFTSSLSVHSANELCNSTKQCFLWQADDWDHDGLYDLLIWRELSPGYPEDEIYHTGGLFWLRNAGGGVFDTAVELGRFPLAKYELRTYEDIISMYHLVDWNGDQYKDVLYTDPVTGGVTVVFHDQSGGLASPEHRLRLLNSPAPWTGSAFYNQSLTDRDIAVYRGLRNRIVVSDFDLDGHPDLMVTFVTDSGEDGCTECDLPTFQLQIGWLHNRGDGSLDDTFRLLQDPVILSEEFFSGTERYSVYPSLTTADYNLDGSIDIGLSLYYDKVFYPSFDDVLFQSPSVARGELLWFDIHNTLGPKPRLQVMHPKGLAANNPPACVVAEVLLDQGQSGASPRFAISPPAFGAQPQRLAIHIASTLEEALQVNLSSSLITFPNTRFWFRVYQWIQVKTSLVGMRLSGTHPAYLYIPSLQASPLGFLPDSGGNLTLDVYFPFPGRYQVVFITPQHSDTTWSSSSSASAQAWYTDCSSQLLTCESDGKISVAAHTQQGQRYGQHSVKDLSRPFDRVCMSRIKDGRVSGGTALRSSWAMAARSRGGGDHRATSAT